MVSQQAIMEALRTIDDPEMPINIVDLGIVAGIHIGDDGRVTVELLPTFVGCPALQVMQDQVVAKVGDLPDVRRVDVEIKFDPPWTVERISDAGRESLRRFGVTVPDRARPVSQPPTCPYCGSERVHMESAFGPTRCRMIYHCDSCHNPFEHLKRVPLNTVSI